GVGDVIGAADALERDHCSICVHHVRTVVVKHGRVDQSRMDRVHADPVIGQLLGGTFRQTADSPLRSAVGGHSGYAFQAGTGGDIDDRAATGSSHRRDDALNAE